MSILTTTDASGLPLEGNYRIENGRTDRYDNFHYTGVYKRSGKPFTAEPKSFSFHQEFTRLQYVNKDKPDGIYIIRETTIAASTGVYDVQTAESLVITNINQERTTTKIAKDHYTPQYWSKKRVEGIRLGPEANDHQIVVNPSNSSPYQMWIFKNL